MASNNEIIIKKWGLVKEQLISLCVFNKVTKGSDDFIKFFSEDIDFKNMNFHILSSVCYFLLGIINVEERNKLIRWPLVNIQSQTKFRKGVSSMVISFQQKYPWANIIKLPESYFLNPHGYESKIVDFILRLSNLAIHITLNDPELLLMHSGVGINSREVSIMTEVITKAAQHEEILIKNSVFPVEEFEDVKNEYCEKCITLKQTNHELQQQLNSLIKHSVSEGLLPTPKVDVEEVIRIKDEKLNELNKINEELLKYFNASKELLSRIEASKNPMSLCLSNFGCENSLSNLVQATCTVCDNLNQFYQYITSKQSCKEKEEQFYKQLKTAKEAFLKEKEVLQSFLIKLLPLTQKA